MDVLDKLQSRYREMDWDVSTYCGSYDQVLADDRELFELAMAEIRMLRTQAQLYASVMKPTPTLTKRFT